MLASPSFGLVKTSKICSGVLGDASPLAIEDAVTIFSPSAAMKCSTVSSFDNEARMAPMRDAWWAVSVSPGTSSSISERILVASPGERSPLLVSFA